MTKNTGSYPNDVKGDRDPIIQGDFGAAGSASYAEAQDAFRQHEAEFRQQEQAFRLHEQEFRRQQEAFRAHQDMMRLKYDGSRGQQNTYTRPPPPPPEAFYSNHLDYRSAQQEPGAFGIEAPPYPPPNYTQYPPDEKNAPALPIRPRGNPYAGNQYGSMRSIRSAPPPPPKPHTLNFKGNFSHSSTQISLSHDYHLSACCGSLSGTYKPSRIDLNVVLSNDNGNFKWVIRGGNFGASARSVRVGPRDGAMCLYAELKAIDGTWKPSMVYLDEHIENQDGNLTLII